MEKFKGHHEGISLVFAQIYDGENVHFSYVKLTITEASISGAMSLLMAGEKYFKRVIIDKMVCQKFLKPKNQDPD